MRDPARVGDTRGRRRYDGYENSTKALDSVIQTPQISGIPTRAQASAAPSVEAAGSDPGGAVPVDSRGALGSQRRHLRIARDLAEIWFWRQSNALVGGEKLWDAAKARDPIFNCANMFRWYAMYSGADIGVTPRPIYLADGRKLPDCYAAPAELRDELTALLGPFPLFSSWGSATTIASSEWNARASIHVRRTRKPTLTLVDLPHLDYGLQLSILIGDAS